MSLKYMDGFDHYATGQFTRKWTLVGGGITAAPAGRFGGSCLRINVTGSTNIYKVLTPSASWVIGFAFRIAGASGGSTNITALTDAGTIQVELRLNPDLTLSVTRNGTALTGGTSVTTLSLNTWYFIEFKATIADSIPANSCKVRINGVDVITVATGQDTKNTANATANGFYLGVNYAGGTGGNWDWDDLYVLDGSGSVNNDFLGDVRVETLYPAGAGNSSQWTPSAGANYACVDDVTPNDDTDFVSSSTIGQRDTYTMSNLGGNPPSIVGVQTLLLNRKDDAGSRQMAAVVRSGGSDYDGASVSVFDTYSYATEIRETDPGTAAAWTVTGVNSMEAGIKLVS
jgi:hypothetical protein